MQNKRSIVILLLLLSSYWMGCSHHSRYGPIESLGVWDSSMDYLFSNYFLDASLLINIDGKEVHYCDQGKGPVLLLLHGFTASLHTWDGWVKALKDKYRIIRLDIVGFGLTGPSKTHTYSRDNWVQFLDKFVTRLKIERFSIAGNSLGGYIAWNYTLDYPHKVNKLILLDPIGYPQKAPLLLNLACFPGVGDLGKIMMPRLMVKLCLKDVYGNQDLVTEKLVDHYFGLSTLPGAREAYINIFRLIKAGSKKPGIGKNIKNISSPTLLMWGKKDRWVPVDLLDKWLQDVPHAVAKLYPGVGHIPMEEKPYLTAQDADQFLSDQLLASENQQEHKNIAQ